MPRPQLTFHRNLKQPKFWLVYVLSVLANFAALVVAYSNSTYMEQFTTPEVVGLLYSVGSCLSILTFLFISRILRKVGNTKFTLGISALLLTSMLVIGLVDFVPLIIVFFVLYLVTSPLIYMTLDVFSESLIGSNESSTGSKRGLTLALMSIAGAAGPFIVALLVGDDNANLPRTYLAAAAVTAAFMLLILAQFRQFKDPPYKEVRVLHTIRTFFDKPKMRNAFLTHLSLQIFFAWAVIYIPLYLATELNYSWDAIGIILTIGLLSYVLFEWPIGYLADKKYGEKEMMAIGFVILIVTLAMVSGMGTATIVAWGVLMFINRVGASLVEVTTESYFFKHTKGTDANLISFFRLTRPLGMVFGSLLGSATLLFLPFELIFIVFALALVPALCLSVTLTDTR